MWKRASISNNSAHWKSKLSTLNHFPHGGKFEPTAFPYAKKNWSCCFNNKSAWNVYSACFVGSFSAHIHSPWTASSFYASLSARYNLHQTTEYPIEFNQEFSDKMTKRFGRKSSLVVSALHSWLEGRGFKFCPILHWNGVKAIPGLIPAPNLAHIIIEKKENIGSEMGHTKKKMTKGVNRKSWQWFL